jgi:pimeloyl-ACP methyl ester carboxylesterase
MIPPPQSNGPAAPMPSCEELEVVQLGAGPPVLLVHGSVVGAERTWRHQLELAEHWTLTLPNRPGFGRSPAPARGDFEAEAPLVAELLGDGAHLVGHSYGAVIALYAAALRPHAVRSLTVSEPGCMRVAAGDPLVDEQLRNGELLYEHAGSLAPLDFLRAFRGGVGSSHPTPEQLRGELLEGARMLMRERPPWEAEPPFAQISSAPFAKLVISGGHSPVFETVCDAVAARIGARREVISGRSHTIPATGAPYNELMHSFMAECERERRWAAPAPAASAPRPPAARSAARRSTPAAEAQARASRRFRVDPLPRQSAETPAGSGRTMTVSATGTISSAAMPTREAWSRMASGLLA